MFCQDIPIFCVSSGKERQDKKTNPEKPLEFYLELRSGDSCTDL